MEVAQLEDEARRCWREALASEARRFPSDRRERSVSPLFLAAPLRGPGGRRGYRTLGADLRFCHDCVPVRGHSHESGRGARTHECGRGATLRDGRETQRRETQRGGRTSAGAERHSGAGARNWPTGGRNPRDLAFTRVLHRRGEPIERGREYTCPFPQKKKEENDGVPEFPRRLQLAGKRGSLTCHALREDARTL